MAEYEAAKEKAEEVLKKYWREENQLPAKFKDYRPAFLEMVKEFGREWDGRQGRTNVTKHRIDLLTNDARQIYSAPYRAVGTARKLPAAETSLAITEKVIEPGTTERPAQIVFAFKKDSSI